MFVCLLRSIIIIYPIAIKLRELLPVKFTKVSQCFSALHLMSGTANNTNYMKRISSST